MNTYCEGKVAVVTGAGGTLCSCIAIDLAKKGAKVVLIGRTAAKLEKTAAEIAKAGGVCRIETASVTDEAAIQAIAETIAAEWGPCRFLVNGAGGNQPPAVADRLQFDPVELTGPMADGKKGWWDVDLKVFESVLMTNTMGTVIPSRVFAKQMAAAGGGAQDTVYLTVVGGHIDGDAEFACDIAQRAGDVGKHVHIGGRDHVQHILKVAVQVPGKVLCGHPGEVDAGVRLRVPLHTDGVDGSDDLIEGRVGQQLPGGVRVPDALPDLDAAQHLQVSRPRGTVCVRVEEGRVHTRTDVCRAVVLDVGVIRDRDAGHAAGIGGFTEVVKSAFRVVGMFGVRMRIIQRHGGFPPGSQSFFKIHYSTAAFVCQWMRRIWRRRLAYRIRSSQKATADAAATLSESTPWYMGMRTV